MQLLVISSKVAALLLMTNSCTSSPVRGYLQPKMAAPLYAFPGGGGGGALGYLGGCICSLSKLKNNPKALISGQKSTLILIKR